MARANINWARGLDELGAGLLRQADIGGRAYEGAMAKEAEQRAANRALGAEGRGNVEWARRYGLEQQAAKDLAGIQHGYRMTEEKQRLVSAEDIVASQIESGEKQFFAGISSREDIASSGYTSAELIAGMNITSAESLNNASIAAQILLANDRFAFQKGESVLDREAQKVNTDALISGRENVAQMTIDARWSELALARMWHMDDAISAATSTKQKQAYEAKVKQAEAEEAGLGELYGELGTEGLDPVRRDEILDLIYDAQDRVAAAWRATGIAPLMSDKHIKESQWKFLAKNIVGAIALEYRNKPKAWEDLIISLHKKKNSSAYKKSVEGIKPTIEMAIDDSLLRGGPRDKTDLKNLVISYLANYRATELSGGYGEKGPPWKDDSTLKGTPDDKDLSVELTDIPDEVGEPMAIPSINEMKAALSLDVSKDELPALVERANVAKRETVEREAKIEGYILSYLQRNGVDVQELEIRKYFVANTDDLYNSVTGKIYQLTPEIKKHLNKYRDAWKSNFSLRWEIEAQRRRIKLRTGAMGLNIEPSAAVDDTPRGMLNEGGRGMIAAVDQGISPQELAQWEPEVVEARRMA